MAGSDTIKVRDRRTFVDEESVNDCQEADVEALDFKPSYVTELEARAQAAEAQLQKYISAYKEEVEGQLGRRIERLEREANKQLEQQRGALVLDLLDVLDNFDRSLDAVNDGADLDAIRQGLTLVRSQFFGALQKLGVETVDAADAPFDPQVHEAAAMAPVSDPDQDGKVVNVMKAGYRLNDRVIRPALVQVGRLSS